MGKKGKRKKGSAGGLVEPSTQREYYPIIEAGIEYRVYNATSQKDARETWERVSEVRWNYYGQIKRRQ